MDHTFLHLWKLYFIPISIIIKFRLKKFVAQHQKLIGHKLSSEFLHSKNKMCKLVTVHMYTCTFVKLYACSENDVLVVTFYLYLCMFSLQMEAPTLLSVPITQTTVSMYKNE